MRSPAAYSCRDSGPCAGCRGLRPAGATWRALIHQAVAYSLVGLGGLHALLTPVFYPAFSADAVWFAGTGLALVFLGALNIAHTSSPDRHIQRLCLTTNVIGTLFCITIAAVVAEPQAYLAVGLAATALIASLRSATPTGATR